MKVKYLKEAAGVKAGTERDLPEALAKALVSKGVVEEVKAAKQEPKIEKKEVKVELETKENKYVSKRKTKNRK